MNRLSSSEHESPKETSSPAGESIPPHVNGATDKIETPDASAQAQSASPDGEAFPPQEPSSMDRVEEMMDHVGKKVGEVTSMIGQHLFRFAAHAREAAEDCWAEAQSIRHKDKDEQPPANS